MNNISLTLASAQRIERTTENAPTPRKVTQLNATQASASPLFSGAARLPTKELASLTLSLPPLVFANSFVTEHAGETHIDSDLPLPSLGMSDLETTAHTLTPSEKQVVLPANHAPADWLNSEANPLYMGPSPMLRNPHFIEGGRDQAMLSVLPDDLTPATLHKLSPENLKTFERIRDSYTTETQTIRLKDRDKVERSVDVTVRKPNRPEPSTYLSKTTIDRHLAAFRHEPCLFLTRHAFTNFCKNGIGRKDGQFLITKETGDKIEALLSKKSTFGAGEAELGLPDGAWANQEIIRVTVNEVPNLCMASGNEVGANKYWMPGGYLPNGLREAVCDQIPLDKVTKKAFLLAED